MRRRPETGRRMAAAALRTGLRAAVLGLALTATGIAANGAELPAPLNPYEAEYRVSRGPLTLGRSVTVLEPATGGWEFRTTVTATGVARMLVSEDAIERSLLSSDGEVLRTLRYEQHLPDEQPAIVDFDWNGQQAFVDNEDGQTVVPLLVDAHDPHGAILSVMLVLARTGAVPDLTIMDDDGDLTRMTFRVRESQRMSVPFGEFEVIEVQRVREDRDRQLIAWFAPELDWLPIRIQQVDRGSTVARMDLTKLNGESGSNAPATPGRHLP